MNTVLTLLRKDLRLFLRNRTAFALTFIVPMVMIYIFGQVFGVGNSGGSGPTGIPLAVISQTDAAIATTIANAIDDEPAFRLITTWENAEGAEELLTEGRARELITGNRLRFALVFPPDTLNEETFGLRLKVLTNPRNEIETQTVNGLLQKVIFTSAPGALMNGLRQSAVNFIGEAGTTAFYDDMAGTIAKAFDLDADVVKADIAAGDFGLGAATADANSGDENASGGSADFLAQLVNIESEQLVGAEVKSPMATRSVGGWAVMFLLFSVTGASTSLFDEKKAGIFQRLLASPVRRSHVLWSKYLFNMLLGTVQLLVLFVAGQVLFGIDVIGNLPSLLVAIVAAATAATAFGMLLASIAPSSEAAQGLATFLILSMSSVGGAWFPTSIMPDFIQTIAKGTIVYWSMEGFLGALWSGHNLIEMLPVVGLLLGIAVVVNAISLWRFNKGDILR